MPSGDPLLSVLVSLFAPLTLGFARLNPAYGPRGVQGSVTRELPETDTEGRQNGQPYDCGKNL